MRVGISPGQPGVLATRFTDNHLASISRVQVVVGSGLSGFRVGRIPYKIGKNFKNFSLMGLFIRGNEFVACQGHDVH